MNSADLALHNRLREFTGYHTEMINYGFAIKPVFARFISLGIFFNYDNKKRNTFRLTEIEKTLIFRWSNVQLLMCTIKRDDPLTLIWSLYHEYAHTTQPLQTKEQAVEGSWAEFKREIDAWIIAEKELRNYPFFKDHLDSYKKFKKERLNSYKKNLKKCKH